MRMRNSFQLSPEQQLLRDSVDRFVSAHFSFEQWRAAAARRPSFDRALWSRMAEMGWLGIGISEEAGGTGADIGDALIAMEGMGRGLVPAPYLGSVVLAGQILDGCTSPAGRQLLQAMMRGEALACVAHAEPGSSFDAVEPSTRARPEGDSFVLSGRKRHVLDADSADEMIVSACVEGAGAADGGAADGGAADGGAADGGAAALFIVPRAATGVHRRDFRGADGRHVSDLHLHEVRVPASKLLASPPRAAAVLGRAFDYAILASLAEALGCMSVLSERTLEYLKTRRQFGVTIGSFQVLRHRMADVAIACEEARSLLLYAASLVDAAPSQRANAVSAAKVRIGQLGTFVAKQAVQMHGAIGVTDELAVGHHFKRLMMIFASFGGADDHLQRFAATREALQSQAAQPCVENA
ncbi:MAG: acyl-CoA dehydrogenase family protein [Burkholderiaceae bacterium]